MLFRILGSLRMRPLIFQTAPPHVQKQSRSVGWAPSSFITMPSVLPLDSVSLALTTLMNTHNPLDSSVQMAKVVYLIMLFIWTCIRLRTLKHTLMLCMRFSFLPQSSDLHPLPPRCQSHLKSVRHLLLCPASCLFVLLSLLSLPSFYFKL